ncbi:MAG: type II toxin-antitoxin system RelE/ParE family toxin [Acidobacteriota bacterium]
MRIRYLDAADAEFQGAVDYYNNQHPGLGFEFSDEVRDAVARIKNYPKAWTPLSKRTRRCQVHRFPYSIVYELRSDLIVIVAIQHHSRKPQNWRRR